LAAFLANISFLIAKRFAVLCDLEAGFLPKALNLLAIKIF
jgi:hypothetical protein